MEPAGKILAAPGVVVERLDLTVQRVDASGRLGPGPGQELDHARRLGRRARGPPILRRLQGLDQRRLSAPERGQSVDERPELPGLHQRFPRQAHQP